MKPSGGGKGYRWFAWLQAGRLARLSWRARDVGQALAAHIGPDATAFPSAQRLAELTGRSRRAVFRALEELQAAGIFARAGRLKGQGSKGPGPAIYRLNAPPKAPLSVSPTDAEKAALSVTQGHRKGALSGPRVHTNRLPENRSGNPAAGARALRRRRPPRPQPPQSLQTAAKEGARTAAPAAERRGREPVPVQVAEVARLLLFARDLATPEPEMRQAELEAAGYPTGVIAAAMALADQLEGARPLGNPDRALSPGRRVPEGQGSPGSSGGGQGPAPRPRFLHDVGRSSICFADGPGEDGGGGGA